MKSFVDAFVKLKNYPLPKKYFLQWLKLYLDDRSRETLPEMHENYAKLRNDFKRSSVSEALKLSDMLLVQSNNLMEGSLGLEHFFRELGQLYEAKISNHCRKGDVQLYPKIAVDILSAGYPIELMDGDASHVPIIWVSAVLNILAKQHKGKKIFVISILGVQSSGKSTLLNTMFGLQFHVSAGRCTRGAFFQLLPVKKSSATFKTKCDFVLIVDTEGVRAPELESDQSFKHDNELATFAIGLADVSIINIFGETPGDLNDIIQTAAHAFIRMKNIDLQLRCHFVHQNVSAVSGDKHAKFGHKKYQDRLDEMTRLAAVAENCEGKYYSFQDIIMFDEDTDVTYFPGLWKGDPPMAPVNPGYSEKALQLKSALVTLADELQSDSNFTAFQIRLEKLWTAVCRENYIFSFKNTLEVIAYNELDAKFGDWSWLLHRVLLDWKYEAGNSVNNCSRDQIATTVSEYLNKAKVVLNKKYDTVFESMQEFFEKSEHARTLAQWKKRYEVRLQHLNEDRIEEAKKFCDSLKVNRECHLKLEDLQKNHRQEILKQLTDLAVITRQNNGKLSSQQIEEMFDRKWNQWLENFSSIEWTEFYPQDTIVEREIDISVQKLLGKYSQNIAAELRKTPLIEQGKGFISFTIDQQRHINYGSNSTTPTNTGIFHKVTKFFGLSKESCVEIATKETDKFISQGKDILSDIRKTFQNFDQSCVYPMLAKFINAIETFNEEKEQLFKTQYIVDIVLTFAGYMTIQFEKLMQEVRSNNNPVESLKNLRTTYLNIFLTRYKDISHHLTAASNLCDILAIAIDAAVFEVLPNEIADSIRENTDTFKGKSYFKVRVLQDLAKRKDFKLYKVYLEDIKGSFEWWAEEYVKAYCAENKGENLYKKAKTIVNRIVVQINSAVKCIDNEMNNEMNIRSWLNNLHNKLSKVLTIDLSEMQDIIEATPYEGCEGFIHSLIGELKKLEDKVMRKIKEPNSKFSNISTWNRSPQSLLCEHLYGCCAQCPFCGEQCELTDADHVSSGKDHYVKIHRPQCLKKCKFVHTELPVFDVCVALIESKTVYRFRNADTNKQWVAYKDYKTVYKDWYISNESPKETLKYWQWFVNKFISDITKWVGSSSINIDHLGWAAVSEHGAIASLSEVYKVT